MLKKLILFAFILLPLGAFAQEMKIAHVNTTEIFNSMPETAAAEKDLVAYNQALEKELKTMQDEFQKKYTEWMQQQDSLAESIKVRRMQEIEDLRNRIENFYQQSVQDAQKKREDLNAPIVQKIQNAIKAVGEEHRFTYIMEAGAFLYVGSNASDATPLVRTKLGLK